MKLSIGLLLTAVALVNVSAETPNPNAPAPPSGYDMPPLSPVAEGDDGRYVTFYPSRATPIDPKLLVGLGPMRTPGDNLGSFATPGNTKPDTFTTFRPNDPSKNDYRFVSGIGPEVRPGMPGYDNAAADKAWKDFIAQQNGPIGEGATPPKCPTTCPEGASGNVCGSNGITYGSDCWLAIDRCLYPERNVQKVSDGPCHLYRAGPLQV